MTQSIDYNHFRKLAKGANVTFISLILILLALIGVSYGYYLSQNPARDLFLAGRNQRIDRFVAYPQGLFQAEGMRLTHETAHIPFPNLSEEILLLGKNDRPDASHGFLKLLLGLKSSGEIKEFNMGDKGYLGASMAHLEGLGFQAIKTPFWFVPVLEDKKLKVVSGFSYENTVLHEWVEQEAEFIIDKTPPKERSLEFTKILQSMQYFLIWPEDLLLTLYGGEKYHSLKGCVRMACKTENGWQMVFIREKDGLVFKESEWEITDFGPATRDCPIAIVEKISDQKVFLKVWDVSGFDSATLEISLAKLPSPSIVLSDIITDTRQRTLQSISCKIGSKKTILKKGDWVLRLPSGWKILETKQEIQNYLSYQLEGELLIFEGLERNKRQTTFKGTWFDKTRSQVYYISTPLSEAAPKKTGIKTTKMTKDLPPDPQNELDAFDELY